MAIGLFADIHSNLEALEAVVKDIESVNPDEVIFLGDIVGYGPNPIECIEILMMMEANKLRGNHDQATITNNPAGFNYKAADAIFWTRELIDEQKNAEELLDFLKHLDLRYDNEKLMVVHGSPNEPTREYILRRDNPGISISYQRALSLVTEQKKWLFAAHAHDSWVYHAGLSDLWCPVGNESIELPADEAAVIMIGSVGQPRDRDSRACWVLLDGNTVEFRRCSYDVDKVVQKIYNIPLLHNSLGDRLKEGK